MAEEFQTPGNHWTTNNVGAFFSYYHTLVTCCNGTSIAAKLRIPCKSPDVVYADNSIVFIAGSVYVQEQSEIAYVDAKHVKVIFEGGDSDITPVPSVFNTHVSPLSTVSPCLKAMPWREVRDPYCRSDPFLQNLVG